MNRFVLAVPVAIALALVAAPMSASATHPQVSGIGTCNPVTGLFDVVWTVTSDPGYTATGEFTSSSRLEEQIVGQSVAGNGAAIDPAPIESVATSAPLELTVGIQFSNHAPGQVVYNTGSVTFQSETCEVLLVEAVPVAPEVKDLCGTADDHYGLPADSDGVSYSRDGLNIVATLADGYKWGALPAGYTDSGDGTATYPFEAFVWDEGPCSTPTPTPPPSLPVTGTDSATPLLAGIAAILLGALVLMWPAFRRAINR